MDPLDFLVAHEPFSQLDGAERAAIADALEIHFEPHGRLVLEREGAPSEYLWIVRKGAVRLEVNGHPIDELAVGEAFGFPSLLADSRPHFDVVTVADTLFYRVAKPVFLRLCAANEAFAHFFRAGIGDRLRRSIEAEPSSLAADLATPIGRLVLRPAVFVDASASVGEAARTMRAARISSVLVRGEPMGILTDRDLRSRVLAEDLGPATPVSSVMSAPLRMLPADAPLIEALLFVLHERLHHLPLERDGEVVGLVTLGDLLRHQVKSPAFLIKRFERGAAGDEVVEYPNEIAAMVESLTWSGTEATEIGRIVAALNDALVKSIAARAEAALGPPPCPYRFIVFGSEGRREQLLITDQDNAIVYESESETARAYFPRLAEAIVSSLLAASFPPCAGGFMATRWCHPLETWKEHFLSWQSEPNPQALLDVANFFDFRGIVGDLDLEPLERLIASGTHRDVFLAQLARASLAMRPPLGLFHRVRQEQDGVDLKASGLMPIVGLARVHALEAGSRERSTLARIEAARRAGTISQEGADALAESFRFFFRLRLDAQLLALRSGERPTNRVRLEALGSLKGRHLKEAFLFVRQMQQALAHRYQVDLLG